MITADDWRLTLIPSSNSPVWNGWLEYSKTNGHHRCFVCQHEFGSLKTSGKGSTSNVITHFKRKHFNICLFIL